jgi:amino acid adenylation domain-containing protein
MRDYSMTDLQTRIAALTPQQRARLEMRLANLAAARGSVQRERIQPRDRARPTPLSYAQQREWALERYRPSNNIPGALRLEGDLDLPVLTRALTEVTARHEVLRSLVEVVDGIAVQVVQPVTPVPVRVVDLSGLAAEEQQNEVHRQLDAEVMHPFPPDQVPLMRATVLRLAPSTCIVLLIVHHSVSDGWSTALVAREATECYVALREGRSIALEPLAIQYGDFAAWQRAELDETWMTAEVAYWREVLADMPPRLALPTDRPYPARRTFDAAQHPVPLPPAAVTAIERFAEAHSASISMVMLAAVSVMLHRYTGQEDLVFGSAIAGRNRTDTEALIGCFANVLPLRIQVSREQTLQQVLRRAEQVVTAAFDHQDLPFDKLVEELVPQETSQTPLIQMMINVPTVPEGMFRDPNQALELPGLRILPEPVPLGPIPIDVILIVSARPGTIDLHWHYSTELFDAGKIERLSVQLSHVLDQLINNPDCRVGDVDLLDTGPARATEAAVAAPADPGFTGLVELFQRQAELAPDASAAIHGGAVVSYAELNRRANRLAHRLRADGVTAETRIGVLMDRSPRLAIAALAALKAGGAVVPLDPAEPPERIGDVLADAAAPVLVTTAALAPLAAGAGVHTLLVDGDDPGAPEENPPDVPADSAAAYVVYSPGSPGVLLEHRSLVTRAQQVAKRLQLGAGDRFLQLGSLAAGAPLTEFFAMWLVGGAVVFPPPETPDSVDADPELAAVSELAEAERVSVLAVPAAHWRRWVAELDRTGRRLPWSLRLVVVGPEPVRPAGVPMIRVYGSAETGFGAGFFRLPADSDADRVAIGTPPRGVRLCVLDGELRPVPTGGTGELYVGGIGVARGYLGQPRQTAERFVADPDEAHPGTRLYRTGDRVRRGADGNVELLSYVGQ